MERIKFRNDVPMEISFVTSSKSKFQLVKDRLSSLNIKLLHHSLDIPEIRDYHVKNVALHKARYAFNVLKRPLIVEDRGFYIEALNGFPGTFVNFMHETIGVNGVTKLMQNVRNRRATFVSVLAYMPSQDDIQLFEEKEEGFILENVVEGDCRGWGIL